MYTYIFEQIEHKIVVWHIKYVFHNLATQKGDIERTSAEQWRPLYNDDGRRRHISEVIIVLDKKEAFMQLTTITDFLWNTFELWIYTRYMRTLLH